MRFPLALLAALALLLPACTASSEEGVAAADDDVVAATSAPVTESEPDSEPEPEPDPEPAPEPDPEPPPPAAADDDLLALPAEGPPVAPDDPSALAAILTAAEGAIRDPARSPEDLAGAGHWQQAVYWKLGERPDWVAPVLAEVPEHLHGSVGGNVYSGQRLLAMYGPANPATPPRVRPLPAWRIVDPPPADELKAYYQEAEAATGVHWTYLAAVNLVETRMGRIIGDSHAGAQGPMQFMPATWAEWGAGDVQDHRDAIMAAARYLRWGGMPGDVNRALFTYNRDIRYVDAVRSYAEQMQGNPRAYYGYYHWQVYFNTRADNVWLPSGYDGT